MADLSFSPDGYIVITHDDTGLDDAVSVSLDGMDVAALFSDGSTRVLGRVSGGDYWMTSERSPFGAIVQRVSGHDMGSMRVLPLC